MSRLGLVVRIVIGMIVISMGARTPTRTETGTGTRTRPLQKPPALPLLRTLAALLLQLKDPRPASPISPHRPLNPGHSQKVTRRNLQFPTNPSWLYVRSSQSFKVAPARNCTHACHHERTRMHAHTHIHTSGDIVTVRVPGREIMPEATGVLVQSRNQPNLSHTQVAHNF